MQFALDLSKNALAKYWEEQDPSGLAAKAIALMESKEDWCGDLLDDNVDEAVTCLANRIALADSKDLEKVVINYPNEFIVLMGVLRSARAILLFRWMTTEHVNLAAFLLNLCSLQQPTHGAPQTQVEVLRRLFTERLLVLERMCLLGRVFSPERLGMVLEIIEEIKNEAD